MKLPGLGCIVVGLALGGCGAAEQAGNRIHGDALTIYSSVPLHGASRADGQAVIRGEQLALAQVRGRVGKYQIALKPLDDATIQRGSWDPGKTTANARVAIQDRSTIGYIGEFNSGASAVSIPLLNRNDIPQISPFSSAVGLTSSAAGAAPGEPQKYYPTGARTFVRLVPDDAVQAAAQVKLQQRLGCSRTYVVDDGEVDGEDMADSFQLVARSAGLDVIGVQAFPPRATTYAPLVSGIAQTGADCVLISAIAESGVPLLARQLGEAMPQAHIFGAWGIAEQTFTDPAAGGIPLDLDHRVLLTAPGAASSAAKGFDAAYRGLYGPPLPAAAYGYEAMSLMLNAIGRATEGGKHSALRSKVLDELFNTRDRQSVLGTYSIKSSGDTTIRRYGVYRIVDGQLRYWESITG